MSDSSSIQWLYDPWMPFTNSARWSFGMRVVDCDSVKDLCGRTTMKYGAVYRALIYVEISLCDGQIGFKGDFVSAKRFLRATAPMCSN
eukprot:scaffold1499_cov170-Amphora_coffeaeformis.AAC.23